MPEWCTRLSDSGIFLRELRLYTQLLSPQMTKFRYLMNALASWEQIYYLITGQSQTPCHLCEFQWNLRVPRQQWQNIAPIPPDMEYRRTARYGWCADLIESPPPTLVPICPSKASLILSAPDLSREPFCHPPGSRTPLMSNRIPHLICSHSLHESLGSMTSTDWKASRASSPSNDQLFHKCLSWDFRFYWYQVSI